MSAAGPLSHRVDPFLTVRSWDVSWGTPRADGSLGYDGGYCQGVLCREDLRSWVVLSAHAPSRIEIEIDEPVELFGFLNASARFDPRNPVEFWVDWNFLGDLTVPSSVTPSKRLRPGRHVLVVGCGDASWRHTLWAMRRADAPAPHPVSVVTIAAFPEADVPREIGLLARSARKFEMELLVCFPGESYVSHADMKIRRLRPILASLEARRVLYVDGRDCLFVTGLERIEAQFERARAPVVMSTEPQCWPLHDPAWAGRFPQRVAGCNWLCAGQWMAERHAAIRALGVLEDLSDRAAQPHRPGEARDLKWARMSPNDDQLLWQVAALNGLIDVGFDAEGLLFRNLSTLDLNLVGNRYFDFTDGATFVPSGEQPCVLHFSGGGWYHAMHQWGGLLGAY